MRGEDSAKRILLRETALREQSAGLRMRDAAALLGVPEAALVEARRGGMGALRLRRPDWPEGFGKLITRLADVGEVMALTRNDACVHEKTGHYAPAEIGGSMGQVVGEIDLRLFFRHWRYGYRLTETTARGPRESLQFFDASGTAIHKVYLRANSDPGAFEQIVTDFADADAPVAAFDPVPQPDVVRPDTDIDVPGFLDAWDGLSHTHEFFGLLLRFGVARAQAVRLGADRHTRRVGVGVAERVLRAAAASGLPLMIFVGNRGCVQIHSGKVHRVEKTGPWLNVLDPRFNLHLREDRISEAWMVRKPSMHGDIHSLELFDAQGECFTQIFGERRPQGRERPDWRSLVVSLPAG